MKQVLFCHFSKSETYFKFGALVDNGFHFRYDHFYDSLQISKTFRRNEPFYDRECLLEESFVEVYIYSVGCFGEVYRSMFTTKYTFPSFAYQRMVPSGISSLGMVISAFPFCGSLNESAMLPFSLNSK